MATKYDYVSFLDKIKSLGPNEIFESVLENAVNLPKSIDKLKIKQFLEKEYSNGSLGVIKDRLDMSIECINRQFALIGSQQEIAEKLLDFKRNIEDLFSVLDEIVKEKTSEQDHEETSGKATSLKSYDEKADELQARLEKIEERLIKYEGTLNDKLFSLIINTVAILGIFVAVAFAGFGANTLFSQINFDASKNAVTNTFYLSLTALFVYNLLFLLFYCIFKVIEQLSPSKKLELWKQCWAFIIIDILGLVITSILFIFVI